MIDWKQLENIAPSERDAVVLALYHAGYTVRPRKRKDGSKTVQYIEYGKGGQYETD